jgi:hypothetical protein
MTSLLIAKQAIEINLELFTLSAVYFERMVENLRFMPFVFPLV